MNNSIFAQEIEAILDTCIMAINELCAEGHSQDEAVLEVLSNFENTMEEHGVRPDERQMMLLDLSAELRNYYHGNKQ
ncbi:MAG: hypothetical protein KZQ83_06740 [gamma proteobacterium symbiont of Taylorina sp.]|nr:hypothetical protein [gamma proteobacterium symbiont of Taylorina sp.]